MNIRGIVPFTNAYVDPEAKHEDESVDGWIGNPSDVERLFAEAFGSNISENYLDVFANDLDKLKIIINGESSQESSQERKFEIYGELFFVSIYVDINSFRLILKQIYLRPCAEKKGLFRVILFQIVRCAAALRCDIFVEHSLKPTIRVLKKAFGDKLEKCDTSIIRTLEGRKPEKLRDDYQSEKPIDDVKYLLIRKEFLEKMSQWAIAFRLGLVTSARVYNRRSDIILHKSFFDPRSQGNYAPRIHMNHVHPNFPSAHVMNYGPASSRGLFTVESMRGE